MGGNKNAIIKTSYNTKTNINLRNLGCLVLVDRHRRGHGRHGNCLRNGCRRRRRRRCGHESRRFVASDDGAKWQPNPGGMPASTVNSVVYGSGTLAYAVQYGKLWESKDSGNSWSPLVSALPSTRIRKLWIPDLASNRLFGITSDLGVLFRN